MVVSKKALLLIASLSLCSCASVETKSYVEDRSVPICIPGVELGVTQVLLKTEWRSDQKEPIERERMATDVIRKVFQDIPCGQYVEKDGSDNSVADTLIEITLREFGPQLVFSVPVVWSSKTDVDATIRVTDIGSGKLRFAASERRRDGGAFAVKSLSDVAGTFESLLFDWIVQDVGGHRD